jgi:hypothetical protein
VALLNDVIPVGSEQSIDFLLGTGELFPGEHVLHHSLHQVDQALEEDLVLEVGTPLFLVHAVLIEGQQDA